jgi:hypothetical protein
VLPRKFLAILFGGWCFRSVPLNVVSDGIAVGDFDLLAGLNRENVNGAIATLVIKRHRVDLAREDSASPADTYMTIFASALPGPINRVSTRSRSAECILTQAGSLDKSSGLDLSGIPFK